MFQKILALFALFALSISSAFAAGMDFSGMTGAVDTATVVTAIIAMGAVMILPGVAKWSVKKIAGFFG